MSQKPHSTGDRWVDRFRQVYLVFFAIYIVSLLLPLAGILFLYQRVMDISEKNCARNALDALTETSTELRAQLNWMENVASRFLLDSQMTSMIYAEPLEYDDKRVNTFNTFSKHLNDLIGDYDRDDLGYRMLFQDSELVFYDEEISHGLEFGFEHSLHYYELSYAEWYEAVFSGNKPMPLPLHDIHLGQMRVRALTYSYPILRRSPAGSRKAVLQFFIQEEDLYPGDFNPLSTVYLIAGDGTVLATIGAKADFPLTAAELSGSMDWQRLKDGLLIITEVEDDMRLAMMIPETVAFHEAYALRWPMLSMFLLCAAIEGLLTIYLAKRNARPIESLASDMTQVLDLPRQGNELEYIHQGILKLQQNRQTALQRSRQIETALLLNWLLNQRTDDVEVLLQSGDRLGIDLRAEGYCAAVIQLPKGTTPAPGAMMPEPPDDMRVIIGEGRRNQLNVLYLIDAEASAEHAEYIPTHLQQLYGQMPQGTRIGQGRICSALDDVTFSFNQVMYCLQQERKQESILSFDQVSHGLNSLHFPLEQQQRIINAVKHNNADILDQEFDLIL